MAQDNNQDDDVFDADFQDDTAAYDEDIPGDEGFEEEDWDSFDEQDESAATELAEPKKKSKMTNIIIVAVAIIGGLGFMVIQAGKGTQTGSPPPAMPLTNVTESQPSAMPGPTNAAPEKTAEQKTPPPTEQGFLNDKKSLEALENDMTQTYAEIEAQTPSVSLDDDGQGAAPETYANQPQEIAGNAAPPMPATINSADALPAPAPAEMPQAAPAMPEATATPRIPQAGDLMKERPASLNKEAAPADELAGFNAVPASAAGMADSALDEKIDQILNRLDKMESDINALRQEGTPAVASSGEQEKIARLEATIEKMEGRIETLQKAPKASAAATPQILGDAPEKPRAVRTAAPESRSASRPARQEAVSWVLKGAQPGQAMVARSGSSEMQTVVVGDSLPGIGRITGVVYSGGRWVVEGTNGSIVQQ